MVEMAMRDDDRTDIGPLETDELKLACELKTAAGVYEQRRTVGRGNDHAGHRPIWMEGRACAKQRDFHQLRPQYIKSRLWC
jgi:hypothetical protein